MKKLLLTGFAVFFAQGTLIQLVQSLAVMVFYTLWMTRVQPFRNPMDNKYAIITAVLLQGRWWPPAHAHLFVHRHSFF